MVCSRSDPTGMDERTATYVITVVEDAVPALDPLVTDDSQIITNILADDSTDAGARSPLKETKPSVSVFRISFPFRFSGILQLTKTQCLD